jgi:hypothetical protein
MFNFTVFTGQVTKEDDYIKRFKGIGHIVYVSVKYVGENTIYGKKVA